MAMYQSVCPVCKKLHIYRESIEGRNNTPSCCGYKTIRKITPPMVTVIGKAAG